MGGSLSDRLRRLEGQGDQWLHDQAPQVSRTVAELEQAGRDAWNAATRTGADLAARTPQELRALGARVLNAQQDKAGMATSRSAGPSMGAAARGPAPAATPQTIGIAKPSFIGDEAWDSLMGADAAVRGAANVLTFGGADHFAAAMDALAGGGVDGWSQRYRADLAEERARDQYDAAHRSAAQKTGQVGGALMGVGLMAPEAAIGFGARLAGAAPLTGREAVALLGGGAATGAATQTAADILTGRKSSPGDSLGAGAGGAANVVALPLGPRAAGAIGGWVTSAAQDAFNGRPIDWGRASDSAMTGGIFGGWAGKIGADATDDMSMAAKGRLGESLGNARSAIRGQPRAWVPKARDYLPDGSYWYPDGVSGPTRFEDKFGYSPSLSLNQQQAQATLGPDFQLFHFTPDDIGRMVSVPAAAFGEQINQGPASSW